MDAFIYWLDIIPKYKDFCIVGLIGKKQFKVKDNHGHITKVHHKDMKKYKCSKKPNVIYLRKVKILGQEIQRKFFL